MLRIFRTLAPVISMILLPGILLAFAPQRISIKGSDTMVILVQRWTELYPDKAGVEFQVTGGGSGVGIAALINGTTDICASSRPMKPAEVEQMKAKYNYKGLEVRVARDGLAIYVHKSNKVKQLTMEQARLIFTGKVTNWKEVGGADKPINLYSRENNSGTYEFFKEHVLLKQDFAPQAQHMAGTAALINAVSKDVNAIGFGGAAYAKNVKAVAIAEEAGKPYITPNETSILSATYPISRFLYFYLSKRPEGNIKKFIDWVISPAGQKVVVDVGYYPIKKM
ncbi:MAG: phosphate ABC transporter substrate-binding protein [Candidatus Kapabacteria bacterium]|nr:phosphate ABC transporter substrate-binding protein [Candidatus Kapabacteria bacterium]